MIRCSCGAELFSIESICSVCIPSKPPRALFVEDLRIKLANRELEILDWKEAAEIANAENDDLRREVAATTKHAQLLNKMLGEAEARAERLRVALLEARSMLAICQWEDSEPDADYEAAWNKGLATINGALGPVTEESSATQTDQFVDANKMVSEATDRLRKALNSVAGHMTNAIICLAAGGTKGSATNILNRAVDTARKAIEDDKQ